MVQSRKPNDGKSTRQKTLEQQAVDGSTLRLAFENTEALISVYDQKGRCMLMNRAVAASFQGVPADFIGKSFDQLHPEPAATEYLRRVQHAISTGQPTLYDDEVEFPSGKRWLLSNCLPVRSENGLVVAAQIISQDITERKQAEAALTKSEQRFSGLLSRLQEAVYRMSIPDGTYEYISPAAKDVFGYEAERFLANPGLVRQILHPDFQEYFQQQWSELLRGKVPPSYEYCVIGADGEQRWIEQTNTGIYDDAGKIIAIEGCCANVTKRVLAQQRQRQLEERLIRAQKMEALGILAGGVAHDLNNVLLGIVSYPDLMLLDLEADSPLRDAVLTIRDSGLRAKRIVQDLLTLARRGSTEFTVLDVNAVVGSYLESPEHRELMSSSADILMQAVPSPEPALIKGSPVHIQKLLGNLVRNAYEAQPNQGRVELSVRLCHLDKTELAYQEMPAGDYICICVEDRGPGLYDDDLDHIFEPFFSSKKMGRSGTGLGLAVVWGVCQDHGGFVDVGNAKDGHGARFSIYLPLSRASLPEQEEQLLDGSFEGNGQRILVVDDAVAQRQVAQRILHRLNYKVSLADSGEQAIAMLQRQRFDLIVLDMIMDPGMDGLECYRQIVKIRPGQRAIIVSGFSESQRVQEAQALGAGPYIAKPYTLERLARAVQQELSQTEPPV